MSARHLVLVTGSLPPEPCGVGHYTWLLANGLSNAGWSTTIATTPRSGEPEDAEESAVAVWRGIPGWKARHVRAAARAMRNLEPDLVHIQYPTVGYGRAFGPNLLPAAIRSEGPPVPILTTFHEPYRWRGRIKNLPNLVASDAIVTVSATGVYPDTLPGARFLVGRKPRAVIAVPPNIPRSEISEAARGSLRRKLLGTESLLVGHFGVPRPNKGLEMLPELLRALPEARLVLITRQPEENAYWDRIEAALRGAEVFERVTVTGYLGDREVADVLSSCDACVYPFRDGLHGRHASFLATVLQGTLTVATSETRTGYVPEENVYYVPRGDAAGAAAAIRRLAGTRRETSGTWPDWDEVTRDHERLYGEILGSAD